MDRAGASLSPSLIPMQRAEGVVVRQRAYNIVKQLRGQGLKPQYMARKIILGLAEGYLAKHPRHRAEPIAEAMDIVEQWRKEGFFGKQAQAQLSDKLGPWRFRRWGLFPLVALGAHSWV